MGKAPLQTVGQHPLIVHRAELSSRLTPILDRVCNLRLKNGIHFIALVSRAGHVILQQSELPKGEPATWPVSDPKKAIQYITTVLRPTFEEYYQLIQHSSIDLPEDIANLRNVRGIRITLDNTHIFVSAVDHKAQNFLLAISWNSMDCGPWTFVGPVNSAITARDDICKVLMEFDPSLFTREEYDWDELPTRVKR